jgi:hypothetical protein
MFKPDQLGVDVVCTNDCAEGYWCVRLRNRRVQGPAAARFKPGEPPHTQQC